MTSDFRPEVEIKQFRACALKMCNTAVIYGRIVDVSAPYGNDSVGHNGLSYGQIPSSTERSFSLLINL